MFVNPSTRPVRFFVFVPVLILLIAAFARLWHFGEAPPGLQHDELFYAQDGRSIVEDGNWRIFYPNNQGREGGYIWFLAVAYKLFGANLVMVKIPALWIALLTVAMIYRFTADQFGYRAAVIAAGLAAVTFWPVFLGRLGLRAATLPLVALVVLWGVWRVVSSARPRWLPAILTGLALGFTAYTYTAWIAVFAAFAAFIPALALFDRARFRCRQRQLAFVGILGLILALPMIKLYFDGTISQSRLSTIDAPWTEFKAGHPERLLQNIPLLAGMPFFTGDPEWRYNIAGRPFFVTPLGLLVYVGLLLVLWQMRRKPILAMLLALTAIGLVPSLLTTSAPSFLRTVAAFPAILIFVAVSIDSIKQLNFKRANEIAWIIGILAIAVTIAVDWPAYFGVWPRSDEVRSIYREDLRLLGVYLLDHHEPIALVSTNAPADYLDPLIYSYSNPRPNLTDVVWFDGKTDIALSEKPTLLFISPLAPISPPQQDWLTEATGTAALPPLLAPDGKKLFDVYRLSATGTELADRIKKTSQWPIGLVTPQSFASDEIASWITPLSFPVNFGNVLELRGVYLPEGKPLPQVAILNGWPGVNMQLYLRPLVNHYSMPINVFVHTSKVVGTSTYLVGQRDFLGLPASSWNTSITFMQDHYTPFPQNVPGRYYVTLGVYNVLTGQRLPILDANGKALGDQILLAAVANTNP